MTKEVFQTIKFLWCRKRRQHKVVDDKGNHNSHGHRPLQAKIALGLGRTSTKHAPDHVSHEEHDQHVRQNGVIKHHTKATMLGQLQINAEHT